MDARFLLDTDTCIYVRRRRPAEVMAKFQELRPGEAVLSVITFGELLYGAAKSPQSAKAFLDLQEFSGLVPVLPLPADAGRAYGAIRAELEARGEMIGSNDLWIAAHARAADLTLVTNNVREFKRVKGLKVQNWVSPTTR
jgi:tRNA(fMet)-specific endonuclease VapC